MRLTQHHTIAGSIHSSWAGLSNGRPVPQWRLVLAQPQTTVLAGLGPAIHDVLCQQTDCREHVDARTKSGQDDFWVAKSVQPCETPGSVEPDSRGASPRSIRCGDRGRLKAMTDGGLQTGAVIAAALHPNRWLRMAKK
jgi:hypothetical protein